MNDVIQVWKLVAGLSETQTELTRMHRGLQNVMGENWKHGNPKVKMKTKTHQNQCKTKIEGQH